MEGGSFIFLAMLAVTIGSRTSALKVEEFANLQSTTGSEGVQSYIRMLNEHRDRNDRFKILNCLHEFHMMFSKIANG